MKIFAGAFLIGAVMVLCLTGTGSSHRPPLMRDQQNGDITELLVTFTKDQRRVAENKGERCLEDCLTSLWPGGSSNATIVSCSDVAKTIADWKLNEVTDSITQTSIDNVVGLACAPPYPEGRKYYYPAYGLFKCSPSQRGSDGALVKSCFFFAMKSYVPEPSLGEEWKAERMVEIHSLHVSTTAYVNTTYIESTLLSRMNRTQAQNAIKNGLSIYHSRLVLDRRPDRPVFEDLYCETDTGNTISKIFQPIDREHKHHHTSRRFQFRSNNQDVIPLLGQHLDECLAGVQPAYSVQHWRDCQAWDHDFNSQDLTLDCKSTQVETHPLGHYLGRTNCWNVTSNRVDVNAIVTSHTASTLDVYFQVSHNSSVHQECGVDTRNIIAGLSVGACFRYSSLERNNHDFQPVGFQRNWTLDHFDNMDMAVDMPSFEEDPDARLAMCGGRVVLKPPQQRFNPVVRASSIAVNPSGEKSQVGESDSGVEGLIKRIMGTVSSYSDNFLKLMERIKEFKSRVHTQESRADCVRFTGMKSKTISNYYTGLNEEGTALVVRLLTRGVNAAANKTAIEEAVTQTTIGILDAKDWGTSWHKQMYKQTDGTQAFLLVAKNRNKDGTINVAYARTEVAMEFAQSVIVVQTDYSILGGFIQWNTIDREYVQQNLTLLQTDVMRQYWQYLCLEANTSE
ncbi:hypothetical protein EC968_005930 [Mortierella alpina]|nr:hypothetical protein EC968_005930 [Mortierella alpina]